VYRGSRKHVLDWTSQLTFLPEILRLIRPLDVCVTADSLWMPRGYKEPDEATLDESGAALLPGSQVWPTLRKWWLTHERGANTPNWDLALACEIDRQPGLLLVEAKANHPELGAGGKEIDDVASQKSKENHERIRAAIAEACTGLQKFDTHIAISIESHYQLSNRLAFAWKLATLNVPTILLYLGFTGDSGIQNVGQQFANDQSWQDAFTDYSEGLVPAAILEKRLEVGPAPLWILVRSRHVLEQSPPGPIAPPATRDKRGGPGRHKPGAS
jgi:hypothetical protein